MGASELYLSTHTVAESAAVPHLDSATDLLLIGLRAVIGERDTSLAGHSNPSRPVVHLLHEELCEMSSAILFLEDLRICMRMVFRFSQRSLLMR